MNEARNTFTRKSVIYRLFIWMRNRSLNQQIEQLIEIFIGAFPVFTFSSWRGLVLSVLLPSSPQTPLESSCPQSSLYSRKPSFNPQFLLFNLQRSTNESMWKPRRDAGHKFRFVYIDKFWTLSGKSWRQFRIFVLLFEKLVRSIE